MKTKIVFVTVSDENDIYLEQTLLSVLSLRKLNPKAKIYLVIDQGTDITICDKREAILNYIDEKVVVDVPKKYSKVQISRYLKTTLRNYVKGDYLYIDSDTIITDCLDDIDNFVGEIGMVLDYHLPLAKRLIVEPIKRRFEITGVEWDINAQYFNSGVMYVRDSEVSYQFYSIWHEKWKSNVESVGIHLDQPPLEYTVRKMTNVVKELDGIWNCQIMNNGLPFLYNAKIIHYFGSYSSRKSIKPYIFHDKQIFLDIKKNGVISQKIEENIDNAKGAFYSTNEIVVGDEILLLKNNLHQLFYQYPRTYSFLDALSKIICFIYSRFHTACKLIGLGNK